MGGHQLLRQPRPRAEPETGQQAFCRGPEGGRRRLCASVHTQKPVWGAAGDVRHAGLAGGGGTWRQEAFFSEHYLMQTCKNDLLRPAQTKLYNGPNIQGHCPPSAGGWGLRNQAGHKRKRHFLCMLEL